MGDSPLSPLPPGLSPNQSTNTPPRSLYPSLAGQVVRGAGWNLFGTLAQKGVALGAAVVVARLLAPSDYAIAGLATSFMGFFFTLTAQGFAQALIQKTDLADIACHSVFWFMAATGLVVGGLVVISAPALAQFYGQPPLVQVLHVLAFSLVLGMIGAVPNALLQRAMRFREINTITVLGSLLSAVLAIGVAWLGYGYWALILPGIGATTFAAMCAFWLSGYRPSLTFRWSEITKVSSFGLSLLGSSLLLFFSDNSDYLIMGRFWSAAAFGQYYFAFERSRQPFNLVIGRLSTVVFPAFSRIQDDYERLRRAFVRGTFIICLVTFPMHVLIIGLADPLLPWIFGEQWRPAVPVFQVFAAFSFARGIGGLVSAVLLAINRPQASLFFNVFRLSVTLPTLLYLGYKGTGITRVSIALLVIWLVQVPFFIGYLYKQIHLSWAESWHSLRPLVGVTGLMGLALIVSRMVGAAAGWSAWLTVTLSILLPSATFVLLARRPIHETARQINGVLRRA